MKFLLWLTGPADSLSTSSIYSMCSLPSILFWVLPVSSGQEIPEGRRRERKEDLSPYSNPFLWGYRGLAVPHPLNRGQMSYQVDFSTQLSLTSSGNDSFPLPFRPQDQKKNWIWGVEEGLFHPQCTASHGVPTTLYPYLHWYFLRLTNRNVPSVFCRNTKWLKAKRNDLVIYDVEELQDNYRSKVLEKMP